MSREGDNIPSAPDHFGCGYRDEQKVKRFNRLFADGVGAQKTDASASEVNLGKGEIAFHGLAP